MFWKYLICLYRKCLFGHLKYLGVPTGFVKNTVLPLYVSIIFLIFRMLWLSYTEEMFGMMLKLSMLLQLLASLKSQRLGTLWELKIILVNGSYCSKCIYFFFLCLSLLKHKLFFISFLEMIIWTNPLLGIILNNGSTCVKFSIRCLFYLTTCICRLLIFGAQFFFQAYFILENKLFLYFCHHIRF